MPCLVRAQVHAWARGLNFFMIISNQFKQLLKIFLYVSYLLWQE